MGFIEDMTKGDVEAIRRLERALHAVAGIVFTNRVFAGAALLGSGLEMLIAEGYTEAQIHQQVEMIFRNASDIRARVARLQMSLVPEPPPGPAPEEPVGHYYRIEIACTECHRAAPPARCAFCSGTHRAAIAHDTREKYDSALVALGDQVLETRRPGEPLTAAEKEIRSYAFPELPQKKL